MPRALHATGGAGGPSAEPGEELAAELIAHVRSRLAGYGVPRSVDFVDDLPRTSTGELVEGPPRDRYRTAALPVPGVDHQVRTRPQTTHRGAP